MKKVLATILALATVATMGITAFATDYDLSEKVGTIYDKDGNNISADAKAGVKLTPDRKIYVSFANDLQAFLSDDDNYKFKTDKGDDNSKMIESIKLLEKKLGTMPRQWYVEVKIKDDMTDSEFKISPSVTFTLKKDFSETYKKDDKITYEQTIWIGNEEDKTDDASYKAGDGGKYYKPMKNEENTVLWEDENDTIATLTFDADSNVNYNYPKLSTKWDNSKYAEKFADQDAFIRSWVGTPSISSTSRATLEINVPYMNEDDELTVDEADIIVYEETADGELVDITAKGSFGYNDEDDFVFTMKTRKLGTYIFATAPAADAAEEVPADVVDADKTNPGTGF